MSETEFLPPAEPAIPALPPPAVAPTTSGARRPLWWVFFGLGFLLLAAGEVYIWHLAEANAADATELAVLRSEVADLQNFALKSAAVPTSAQPTATVQADISQKLADLDAQVNVMQTQDATDHAALTTLQANSADLTQLTARMTLLSQLENARLALDSGQPLGSISNAPPALAQFATIAPPTIALLRETFPAAAKAAEAASVAGETKSTYWSRVLARLENFITITNGSDVVLGAPAAGVIAQAQTLLDAGDLAGAVAQLSTLSQPTQQAMGPWLAQANALLAAQSALLALAGRP
jgi:hypothetical protein